MTEQRLYSIGACHVCRKPLMVHQQQFEVINRGGGYRIVHDECVQGYDKLTPEDRNYFVVTNRLTALENLYHVIDILQDVIAANRKKIDWTTPFTIQRGKI